MADLEGVFDKSVSEVSSLSTLICVGYHPNLIDKIPNGSAIISNLNSVIILDTETNKYIVIKKVCDLAVSGFSVLNNLGEIHNYSKYFNKNVIIPIKLSKFKELNL